MPARTIVLVILALVAVALYLTRRPPPSGEVIQEKQNVVPPKTEPTSAPLPPPRGAPRVAPSGGIRFPS
jgi:hypothetical protein